MPSDIRTYNDPATQRYYDEAHAPVVSNSGGHKVGFWVLWTYCLALVIQKNIDKPA